MKKLILILIIFLFPITAYAEYDIEIRDYPEFSEYATDIASGNNPFTWDNVLNGLKDSVFGEITRSKGYLLSILTVSMIAGFLKLIDNPASDAQYFSVYAVLSAAVIKLLAESAGYAMEVIDLLADFITKFSPVFLGLLFAAGKMSSAAAFSPILSGCVYVLTLVVDSFIMPVIYLSAVLGVVGNISGKVQLGSFNKLLRSTVKWILTALLTVFVSISGLYGFNSPVIDALGVKGAKFAIGTMVPVVGGLLADTMDTVMGGTYVLKNAVGSAGMIVVIALTALPIIKVWVVWFLLRLLSAVSEPISDMRSSIMLRDLSEVLGIVLAVMLTAVMLFLITIGIILASTGGS
ncbi:MAG: stage III sporulation protein AE [Clostridia bacterium]|nr:stage III sporulation protein AE [Clostridia bacterium]